MAENNSNDNKLPHLPKVHASLPKLPSLNKKPAVASKIPALSSQATQLPEASISSIEEDAGETEAIAQPSAEAIEKALAKMRQNAEFSSKPLAVAAPALGSSASNPSINSGSMPGLSLSSSANPGQDRNPALGSSASNPNVNSGSMPGLSQSSAASPRQSRHSIPVVSAIPLEPAQAQAPVLSPLAPSIASQPMAAPIPQTEPEDDSEPVFGGAAAENSELFDEDEAPDDLGEKTLMLDEMADELDVDDENQKTQINMDAMDYDPLSGKLVVESGKTNQREYILVREKTTIGRVPKNDIAISDISMSRHHADIDKFHEGFRLRDLDSANGTILNGYRIRVAQLRNGDIIEIGTIRFRFEQTGGDPEELWKGEPKIEYHPNQKGAPHTQGVAPSLSNAPSIDAPTAQPFAPPQSSQGMPYMSAPGIPLTGQSQQMEAMLERQGGGLAAAQWPTASPMTTPYMMGYGPNALRNVNTTPLWANIVLVALVFICLGSITWFIVSWMQATGAEKDIENRENLVKRIDVEVTQGINAYADSRFEDALKYFTNATELDKDGLVIKEESKPFFENYRKLILKEDDILKEIHKIRTNLDNSMSIEEFEDALKFLDSVPDSSVNLKSVESARARVLGNYTRRLKKDIRNLAANDKKFNEARALLAKLSTLPETAADVKSLSKLIADNEKAQ